MPRPRLDRGEDAVDLREQGVHYAQAWDELKQVAELLEAPVSPAWRGRARSRNAPAVTRRRWQHHVARAVHARQGIGRGVRRRRQLQPRLLHQMANREQDASSTALLTTDLNKNIPAEYPFWATPS